MKKNFWIFLLVGALLLTTLAFGAGFLVASVVFSPDTESETENTLFENVDPGVDPGTEGNETDHTQEITPDDSLGDVSSPSAEEIAEAEAIFGCSLSDVDWNEYMPDGGYILFDSAKNPIFVWDDGSFAVFEDRPEMPAELESGDRILILRWNMILETYPCQIVVSHMAKTEDGSLKNIPRRVVEDLEECGFNFDFVSEDFAELPASERDKLCAEDPIFLCRFMAD